MRRSPIAPMSERRRAEMEQQGVKYPTSTFAPSKPKAAASRQVNRRAMDTGPKRIVRDLVRERSGGMCEWPVCPQLATDVHHRLGRKQGGRHGDARERINGAAWLLHACRPHHVYVTSPVGDRRAVARTMGWLLHEHEDGFQVPVWTRHDAKPVWLLADGSWLRFEEANA